MYKPCFFLSRFAGFWRDWLCRSWVFFFDGVPVDVRHFRRLRPVQSDTERGYLYGLFY